MTDLALKFWIDDTGQDIAEYAVMLAVIHGVPTTKKTYLTYRRGPITSCFIRRISKRSAPARPQSADKSA
jgi:hypothetical protein